MIKLMADSTCDLTQEVVEKYNIGIAPLNILIGDQTYKDKIDLTSDEFFARLPDLKELPTTSMPSPEEYLSIIDQGIKEGYTEFLCISMSSGTSGSYQSAVLSKDLFYEQNPNSDIRIHIVDSKSMSHGSGWLLLKTAQMIEAGATFDELVEFNETHKKRVKHFLCVDDLHNLIKSGRISNAGAMIVTVLRVKPIMSMKAGKGAIIAKERGLNKALKYYVEEFKKRVDMDLTNFVIVGYSSDISIADKLKARLREETEFLGDIYLMQMGVAVGTHVGLGGVSMFFMEKAQQ